MAVSVSVADGIATVTIDNPPVNAASHAVREGLVEAVKSTEADATIRAVVLACSGRTFVAGADVKEFGLPPKEPILPDVVLALEAATKPWVAAIHGSALGGGLEIALGCSHRIAAADAKLGLPEVTLGLIPGAGGTVRLPRLIAAEPALDMIAGGRPVSSSKAAELGLVDRISTDGLTASAQAFAKGLADAPRPPPLLSRDPKAPKDAQAWEAQKAAVAKKARGQNAPIAATEAVQAALDLSGRDALAREREVFLQLKADPQSSALRHIFFAERAASKIDAVGDATPGPIDKIGVIGGGTMGAGIAAACLLARLHVTLIERDGESLSAGQERIENTLAGSLKRGLISPENHQAFLSALTCSTDEAALADANLIIEAVFEDLGVKKEVFQRLEAASRPDAVLATNTSYLDVADIAGSVTDPSRVIGLHFFSPAHIMKLLELVIPDAASPKTVATGAALGKRLRKIVVPAGVCDGFIGNRIMSRYRRECDYMLVDGALPHQIDGAMRGFGFPMGIYEMQDLAGLDISWAMRKRKAATRDPAERYVTVADQLCEAGRFGRKTGKGWYLYADGKTPQNDDDVITLIEAESIREGITRQAMSDDAIIARILGVMQDEGRTILAEEIAARASDIDVVMVNGYGFPRWRGGPMFMASL